MIALRFLVIVLVLASVALAGASSLSTADRGQLGAADVAFVYDFVGYDYDAESRLQRAHPTLGGEPTYSYDLRFNVAGDIAAPTTWVVAAKAGGGPVIRGGPPELFDLHPRVLGQLGNPRLGPLAGRLQADDLQRLANAPSASRYLDARTGNINVIQSVQGVTLRITTPRDAMRIISVGLIRPNQVTNRVASGDFVPLP